MDGDSTTTRIGPATPEQSWVRPRFTLTAKVLTGVLLLEVALILVAPRRPIILDEVDHARLAISSTWPLAKSLELYRQDFGTYPIGKDGLKCLVTPPEDDDARPEWRGPYLDDPDCLKDPWGTTYQYRFPGQHDQGRYELWSAGPDRENGTEDDITEWRRDE